MQKQTQGLYFQHYTRRLLRPAHDRGRLHLRAYAIRSMVVRSLPPPCLLHSKTFTPDTNLTYVLLSSEAEIIFGLLCSCLVIMPRLYQHFCAITPLTTRGTSTANDQRAHTRAYGRSKKEWVDLGDRAERARDNFHKKARLGDEEAVDSALNDGG